MTETSTDTPLMREFTTDFPIMLGGKELVPAGTKVSVRKPGSGELRGLKLTELIQLDVASLEALAPRITMPIIYKGAVLDPSDLMQFGGEVMDFLLPKSAKDAVSPQA
ncbi:phage tail protein [Sphingomonas panacis]|uniref:Phage tail protein n=1 Tax=Sphingomonas panacis TaxID=1560345 RepID=A0A1B3Z8A1_9SPHN|nr:phage tail assembly protein [Sphingomonas panacis]AOH83629.1 phage tail protein [Sphingomonas panacis]